MQTELLTLPDDFSPQRVDNFLVSRYKGVPKTRLYKAIRKGEVRVNKKRVTAEYRLQPQDIVRMPPLRKSEKTVSDNPPSFLIEQLKNAVIYEDKNILAINKPARMAVHSGSGLPFGVIETLRYMYPKIPDLELVHRLDRDTSGCLLLAKKRGVLKALYALFNARQVTKVYLAWVKGQWAGGERVVDLPLKKNIVASGERIVCVDSAGKASQTRFVPLKVLADRSLLKVEPVTGRTHQIRVHAKSMGHPIIGDPKYGDDDFNKRLRAEGIKRMLLHASELQIRCPEYDVDLAICACLDPEGWLF